MRPFGRKPSAQNGYGAVAFTRDGVAAARVARRNGYPPSLEGCAYHALEGTTLDARGLGRFAAKVGLDRSACSVLMEPSEYTLVLVEAPDVPPDELKAALRWRIRELIDFHVDDAVVDAFDLPEHTARGRMRMMYVVAARTAAVRERVELMQGSGLPIQVVDIPELAQRNLAACLPEDAGGVALLSLAPHSGMLTVTRQSSLYLARRMDNGPVALHEALGECSWSESDPVPGSVTACLDTLVVEVQRSLDYYESHFARGPVGDLVIAPMERPVPGMAAYFADQLGINVRHFALTEVLDCAVDVPPEVQSRCLQSVGAALRVDERTL